MANGGPLSASSLINNGKKHMIKLLGNVPRDVTVAVSGGVDSMALLDFLSRNHNVNAAFFHHGTENSEQAYKFLKEYLEHKNVELIVGHIKGDKPAEKSPEEYWRDSRYEFLTNINRPVAMAHNLDDCVETWIWSSLHGCSKLIPYQRQNVFRPLLITEKKVLQQWCINKSVSWIEDTSNKDVRYMRNYIRHELMPHALVVNPGIKKVIKKMLLDRANSVCYN